MLSHVQLFCNPMDCNLPGFSVHGVFQTRILEQVAISFSRGSSRPRDWACVSWVSCMAGRCFTTEPPGKPKFLRYQSFTSILQTLLRNKGFCPLQLHMLEPESSVWLYLLMGPVKTTKDKWDHKGGTLIQQAWCPYKKRMRQKNVSYVNGQLWGHSEKMAISKPGRESSQEQISQHLDPGLCSLQNRDK